MSEDSSSVEKEGCLDLRTQASAAGEEEKEESPQETSQKEETHKPPHDSQAIAQDQRESESGEAERDQSEEKGAEAGDAGRQRSEEKDSASDGASEASKKDLAPSSPHDPDNDSESSISSSSSKESDDQPLIVKKRKMEEGEGEGAPSKKRTKLSSLKRKEMKKERMERKKQERLARKKAEVLKLAREAYLDKLENTKIGDLLKMQEDPRLGELRRFVCAAGMRCNYKQMLKDCLNDQEKIRKIEAFMESKGLEVKSSTTIEQCKIFKLKKERERELADLDVGNIITETGRSLRSRGERKKRKGARERRDEWSSEGEEDSDSSKPRGEESGSAENGEEEAHSQGKEFKEIFSGLKGIVDSGGESD